MERQFAESIKEGGTHFRLHALIGEWEGTNSIWLKPGQYLGSETIQGRMQAILDGRFILHTYRTQQDAARVEGLAIIGYDLVAREYQMAWVDTFHTSTSIMYATSSQVGAVFSVLGEYQAPEGPPWGWRTTIDIVGNNQLTITAYNIPPHEDSDAYKAVEIRYRRVGLQ